MTKDEAEVARWKKQYKMGAEEDAKDDAAAADDAEAAAQHQSAELAEAHQSAADSVTKELFHSFQTCGQSSNFQRFGEKNDGGYLMCMDGLKKESFKAAYSLGVEHHDKWS